MTDEDWKDIVVACVDVGSPARDRVGYAIIASDCQELGRDLDAFVCALSAHVESGRRIAIGFECPLYLPVRKVAREITGGRIGEGRCPWSAAVGASVLATGLALADYVFRELKERVARLTGTTEWTEFESSAHKLLVWEAFVTRAEGDEIQLPAGEPASEHIRDALAGAMAFRQRFQGLTGGGGPTSDLGDEPAMSLAGLALLHSGLSIDTRLLSSRPLVTRVRKPN